MKKICFVLTVEFAVKAFMLEHIKKLSTSYEISVIVNTKNLNFLKHSNVNAKVIPLNISREISPFNDFLCLLKLIKIFYINKFDAVHSITPKAGLLGMLAAFFARIKLRVHTFQGEVWVTKKGLIRALLMFLDKLVALIATNVTVVSESEKDFLISNKILNPNKAIVFNKGSIAGVNLQRFHPDMAVREKIRVEFGFDDNDIVFLFIGRLNKDKGVLDLVRAFNQIENPECHLLIVGPDEHNLTPTIKNILSNKLSHLHLNAETDHPEWYMVASEILCLPSYREGFGVVIIEAAACGITSIASRVYGISDAIVENETGLLYQVKNIGELKEKLELLASNHKLRIKLSKKAQDVVSKNFDSTLVTQAWFNFYSETLK